MLLEPLNKIKNVSNFTGLNRIATFFNTQIDTDILKKEALYFDYFGFWNCPNLIEDTPDLQYLRDEGLIFELEYDSLFDEATNKWMSNRKDGVEKIAIKNPTDIHLIEGTIKRISAEIINNIDGFVGVPLYLSNNEFSNAFNDGKQSCLSIILKNLPRPDENTPWESIIEFRNNPEAIRTRKALLQWQNTIVKANKTPNEIYDEFHYLLSQYEHYMKQQKIKIKRSIAKIIVVGVAEFVENLCKLKFKSLAENLFVLGQQSVDLELEKLKAPGKELAYISYAHEKFK
jgi:hypothetical protein